MTEGESITRLCQLRDEMKQTPQRYASLCEVMRVLDYMVLREWAGSGVTYEQAKKYVKGETQWGRN